MRPIPGDPWGVEQHHWNTGAKESLFFVFIYLLSFSFYLFIFFTICPQIVSPKT